MPPDYPQSTDEPPQIGGPAIDAAGTIYVADWYNGRVRQIVRSGIITTIVGGGNAAGTSGKEDIGWRKASRWTHPGICT